MPELTDQNGEKLNMSFGRPTDNVPHDVEIEHVQATVLAAGVQLQTRDGSRMGNAIIMKQAGHTSSVPGVTRDYIPIWLVQTDFGNIMKLTSKEIDEVFTLDWISDYDRWYDARLELIRIATEEHG